MREESDIEVVKELPLDRIIAGTNSPWCNLSDTFAGAKYAKTDFKKFSRHKFVMGY